MIKDAIFIARTEEKGGSYRLTGEDEVKARAEFEKFSLGVEKPKTTTTASTSTSLQTINHNKNHQVTGAGNYYSQSNWGSSTTTTYGTSKDQTKAFNYAGVNFFGGSKTSLDKIKFSNKDLIINATGIKYVPISVTPPEKPKPFISFAPEWLKMTFVSTKSGGEEKYAKDLAAFEEAKTRGQPDQIVLDWTDMQPPPETVTANFWLELAKNIKDRDIENVYVCCTAGQGRTGTVLSCLMYAFGVSDDYNVTITFIRKAYSSHAVETKGQEGYLKNIFDQETSATNSKYSDDNQFLKDFNLD